MKPLQWKLEYSKWHRTLGYSYFAMDIDYIEIRNNQPVAVIETSICTSSYPNCDGKNGVIDRFLQETGGFQFEVAYWVAKWLNVDAFIVCIDPNDEKYSFEILNLKNGEFNKLSKSEYMLFLNQLPSINNFFSSKELELPRLLEKLHIKYPGIDKYPYFSSKSEWNKNFTLRVDEIQNRIPWQRPKVTQRKTNYPVKGETTGERPENYSSFRDNLSLPYFNLEWVEWRKDNPSQKIGRPSAVIKTIPIKDMSEFKERA